MKKRIRHILQSFGLVLLCQTLLVSGVHAQEKITLQLKWTHAFQFAGYYAAIEKGYYRDAGLEVTINEAIPETDPVSEVLEGKAQYGVGSSGLLLSRAAGKPVVVLAVIFQHSPYEIYASTKIHHLNDLIGKRMMLEPQSEEIIAYLKKEGIPLDSLALLPHTFSADALINGQTDAMSGYVSSEPYFFRLADFPYQIFNPQSAGIDFYGDNLFTSEQELAKFPKRVKAFREASLKGWHYTRDHRDEIIDLIYNKYSKDHTLDFLRFESEQMILLLQPDLVDIGYMNQNRWKHIAKTYASIGLLKADFSLEGFIYNPDERNLKSLYLTLGLAVLIIFVISMIAFYIFKFNRKLAMSIKKIKQTDEILAEGEKSYHGLFNSVTEAIYIQDENGYFIDVNVGVEKMYGFSRNEIIGNTPEFLSAPGLNDLPKISELIKKTFITGQPQLFEFWGKRKNGEIFPKEVICNKGRYFGKDVIITTARDITDRKRTEGTLRETNAYLENLLNYANAPIIVWDSQFRITRFNHAFEHITGRTEAEVVGQSLELLFPPNLANYAMAQIHKTLTGERWETVEIEILHRDNSRRTVLWNSATIFASDGKTPVATIAQGQDITGRKKTEEKLRNLFENAPIGIFHSLPGGRFLTTNPPLAKMLGYSSPEELVELTSDMTTQIYADPNIRPQIMTKLMKTDGWVHLEDVIWRRKDGSLINVDMTGRKVLNPDGSIAYLEGFIKDVTEQKKAEMLLRESEEKFREMADLLPQIIFETDLQGRLIYVNKQAYKIMGYDKNDPVIGLSSLEFHIPEERSRAIDNIQQKMAGKIPGKSEFSMLRKDGSTFPAIIYSNYYLINGKPAGLRGLIVDISDIKKAQNSLQETNAYLENLINYANAPIIVWDSQFRITRFNHAFEFLTGRKETEVIGQSLELLFPPNHANIAMEQIRKTLTGERWEAVEIEILHRDNSRRTVLWNSATIFASDGKTPVATIAQGQDITGRKQTEEALKKSEEKYRLITENTGDVIWILNLAKQKFTFISPSIYNLRGYTVDEAMSQSMIESLTPESLQIVTEGIQKTLPSFLKNKNTNESRRITEVRQPCKNGQIIWVEVSTQFQENSEGEVEILGVSRNIEKRKEMEDELRKSETELKETNSQKDKFFSIIAHDLKNPFNSILGFSELLKDEARNLDLDSIIQYSGIIHSTAQHTYELLESLLEWARMQQGRIPFEPRTLLLNDIFDFEIEGQKIYAVHKNIQLKNGIHENLIVSADENMISTVVRNLISNAIKFTPKNGKVELTARIADGQVEISVTDNGIGMSADALNKLFKIETSFSTRGTENEKGTGLGLLLCKEFIEKHGGKIWVESTEAKGSIFTFTIPFP